MQAMTSPGQERAIAKTCKGPTEEEMEATPTSQRAWGSCSRVTINADATHRVSRESVDAWEVWVRESG